MPDAMMLFGEEQSPAALTKKQATLRARARTLAQEPAQQEAAEAQLEVVEFVLAGEIYAVETAHIREVYPLKDLTPLPCTPSFVRGIINVRGQILAVVDLKRFFDLPQGGLSELNKVIIVQDGKVELGILADSIRGARALALRLIQPPLPTLTGVRADYLRGVTNERVIVLDVGRILCDQKVIIDEEVAVSG